jgi:hypothetical protein
MRRGFWAHCFAVFYLVGLVVASGCNGGADCGPVLANARLRLTFDKRTFALARLEDLTGGASYTFSAPGAWRLALRSGSGAGALRQVQSSDLSGATLECSGSGRIMRWQAADGLRVEGAVSLEDEADLATFRLRVTPPDGESLWSVDYPLLTVEPIESDRHQEHLSTSFAAGDAAAVLDAVDELRSFYPDLPPQVALGYHQQTWWSWGFDRGVPDYFPPVDGMGDLLAAVRGRGFETQLYANTLGWDPELGVSRAPTDMPFSLAEPHVARTSTGAEVRRSYPLGSFAVVCHADPWWSEQVRALLVELLRPPGVTSPNVSLTIGERPVDVPAVLAGAFQLDHTVVVVFTNPTSQSQTVEVSWARLPAPDGEVTEVTLAGEAPVGGGLVSLAHLEITPGQVRAFRWTATR